MAVVLDIEDGGELTITAVTTDATRIATVSELQGSTLDAMLWDAFQALAVLSIPEGGPITINTPHLTIPGIVALRFTVTPTGLPAADQTARIAIDYGIAVVGLPPDPGPDQDGADHKEIRFFSQARRVTRDPRDDSELIVQPPAEYSTMKPQTKTVTVDDDLAIIVFERTESSVPTARARDFQGTTNVETLPPALPVIYEAKTVKCRVIHANTRDAGGLYRVRYEFLHNKLGHKIEYKWENASLPVETYDANSRKEIEPNTKTFALLGLDWSD